MLRAVVFDVGETLIDETREYGTWADWLGVRRHTFVSVFGAVIASGKDYRERLSARIVGGDYGSTRVSIFGVTETSKRSIWQSPTATPLR